MNTLSVPSLTHDQAWRYLHAGRDQLSPTERGALHTHLVGCTDCQAYSHEFAAHETQLMRALRARWGAVRPSDDFALRLQLRLTADTRRQRVLGAAASFASAAALIVVIVLAVMALNNTRETTLATQPHVRSREQISTVNTLRSVTTTLGALTLPVAIGDRLQLIGFDLANDQLVPGSAIDLTLRWQTQYTMTIGYLVFMHIVDAQGNIVAQLDAMPTDGARPTQSWAPGETIIDRHVLMLPITAAPGQYALLVGLYESFGGVRQLTSLGGNAVQVATLHVGTIPNRLNVNLEKFAALLGYALETTEVKPGAYLAMTLYWQARTNTLESYQSFVQLRRVDDQTPIVVSDAIPGGGSRPTPTWNWGETVPDRHLLRLPDDLPPGKYNLVAGLYATNSGERLNTTDGQAVITLTQLDVK